MAVVRDGSGGAARRWRVAVVRDEPAGGRLSRALEEAGFEPRPCPVAHPAPPLDPAPLAEAARHLDRYDWVVFASQRAVDALLDAGAGPWPPGIRTAAVGPRTAAAL